MTSHARTVALERFRWTGGHSDVWPIFRDPGALAAVVRGLAGPFRDDGVTAVRGVESRGFLLGAAVAVELGVGFVAVRKGEGIFPGARSPGAATPTTGALARSCVCSGLRWAPGTGCCSARSGSRTSTRSDGPSVAAGAMGTACRSHKRLLNEFHKRGVSLPRTAVNRVT